jgi:hypothetical protein
VILHASRAFRHGNRPGALVVLAGNCECSARDLLCVETERRLLRVVLPAIACLAGFSLGLLLLGIRASTYSSFGRNRRWRGECRCY